MRLSMKSEKQTKMEILSKISEIWFSLGGFAAHWYYKNHANAEELIDRDSKLVDLIDARSDRVDSEDIDTLLHCVFKEYGIKNSEKNYRFRIDSLEVHFHVLAPYQWDKNTTINDVVSWIYSAKFDNSIIKF